MNDHIFFNEEWNRDKDYCYKHGIQKDMDGQCYKCLEEKNNKNGTGNRKLQGIRNNRKKSVGRS